MKPKELKVGDKVFLVKEASFLSPDEVLEVVEVSKVTRASVYVDDTRFPIKAKFPLLHKSNNLLDTTQHLWLTSEDYNAYLAELRKAKESRAERALQKVSEGLSILSDEQLDKLATNLKKTLISLGPTQDKKEGSTYDPEDNTTR